MHSDCDHWTNFVIYEFPVLFSSLTLQEYKARKRERLQKKITAQVRQDIQKAEAAATAAGSVDLMQILDAFSDKGKQSKGSRFTHAERLQFAQVN